MAQVLSCEFCEISKNTFFYRLLPVVASEESVGVKFKEDIWGKLCLKLWFESDCYVSNITKSVWFSKRLSRKKDLNNLKIQQTPHNCLLKNVNFSVKATND